jgi:hypothetical protein
MTTKSYILNEKHIGKFATIVALQDGDVSFKKDSKSKLYIAKVEGSDIEIPEKVKALEMNLSASTPSIEEPQHLQLPGLPEPDENTIDLVLRLQMNEKLDPEKVPIIYEEIAKAIENAIKKIEE